MLVQYAVASFILWSTTQFISIKLSWFTIHTTIYIRILFTKQLELYFTFTLCNNSLSLWQFFYSTTPSDLCFNRPRHFLHYPLIHQIKECPEHSQSRLSFGRLQQCSVLVRMWLDVSPPSDCLFFKMWHVTIYIYHNPVVMTSIDTDISTFARSCLMWTFSKLLSSINSAFGCKSKCKQQLW